MKIKIFFLTLICIFFGVLINKHNELIKVPKEDRKLIQVSEKVVKGKVIRINDGDSFVMQDNIKVRLYGIDAPELNQICLLKKETIGKDNEVIVRREEVKCGEDAKNKLSDLIAANDIVCIVRGKDAYDRFVGDCSFEKYNGKTKRKDKVNINKEMVLSGNAVAFHQISDKYLEDENRAKAENKGIWATTFDIPSNYRKKAKH